jgi:hypothetical protein
MLKFSLLSADGVTTTGNLFRISESLMKIDDRVSNYMSLLNSVTTSPPLSSGSVPHSVRKELTPPIAVDISPVALQRADDEARRERMNTIRRQLADGSYNISGKDVADKMLRILKS